MGGWNENWGVGSPTISRGMTAPGSLLLLLEKSNVVFCCKRCLEESPVGTVLQKEVEIELNVKLECVPKFCYLGDTLGAGGGVDEAARAL